MQAFKVYTTTTATGKFGMLLGVIAAPSAKAAIAHAADLLEGISADELISEFAKAANPQTVNAEPTDEPARYAAAAAAA